MQRIEESWLMALIFYGFVEVNRCQMADDGPWRFELENAFGNSGFGLSSQRSFRYWRPRPARDGPPGDVRSGRYPVAAFFGRLMSSLHSDMMDDGRLRLKLEVVDLAPW